MRFRRGRMALRPNPSINPDINKQVEMTTLFQGYIRMK
jgi:hypothetical protein